MNVELVSKIFRSLPKEWEPKVTAIVEAKDLTTLEPTQLIGSQTTYEMIDSNEVEKKKKKKNLRMSLGLNSTQVQVKVNLMSNTKITCGYLVW